MAAASSGISLFMSVLDSQLKSKGVLLDQSIFAVNIIISVCIAKTM